MFHHLKTSHLIRPLFLWTNGGLNWGVPLYTIIMYMNTCTCILIFQLRVIRRTDLPLMMFITRWTKFLRNNSVYHVTLFVIGRGSQKMFESAMDVNNNNDVTSTSASPFVELTFYNFTSQPVFASKREECKYKKMNFTADVIISVWTQLVWLKAPVDSTQ